MQIHEYEEESTEGLADEKKRSSFLLKSCSGCLIQHSNKTLFVDSE